MNEEQQIIGIKIPEHLSFNDLKLERIRNGEYAGDITFDLDVVEQICEASNLPKDFFMTIHEDNIASLFLRWYMLHLEKGGEPDPVFEEMYQETLAEMRQGQMFSLKPGTA